MQNKRKVIPGIHLLFRRFNKVLGENEYLLHKRINTRFLDGHFSVPGGHIDDYESPIDCAIREAKEELCVHIDPKNVKFINIIYRTKKAENEVRTDFCFIVNKWKGILKSGEPHKHSEPKWYPVSKFPRPMVPYVKTAIKDIEQGIAYTKTNI